MRQLFYISSHFDRRLKKMYLQLIQNSISLGPYDQTKRQNMDVDYQIYIPYGMNSANQSICSADRFG